ncbi:MAG TPA: hypothetical protein VIY73_24675 [Polyangiaceae bacterium]
MRLALVVWAMTATMVAVLVTSVYLLRSDVNETAEQARDLGTQIAEMRRSVEGLHASVRDLAARLDAGTP